MRRAAAAALPLLLAAGLCEAQVDPARRRLLQFGYDQSLGGAGPMGAYAFFYFSEPKLSKDGPALRIAIAPVYADSEVGFKGALGPDTDLALGLAGGGFAQGHAEVRAGRYYPEESFNGNGATANGSLYHLFNPGAMLPLSGLARLGASYSDYNKVRTAREFSLPPDHVDLTGRVGFRLGGEPPELATRRAAELSGWYEGRARSRAGAFGYAGENPLHRSSHRFWARALFAYTLESSRRFAVSITAGTSKDADRMNAYYLGGTLPLAAEFALPVPGYYNAELAASRFVLAGGRYDLPVTKTIKLTAQGGAANTRSLPGMGQPGAWNLGAGAGVDYNPHKRIWKIDLAYARGFRAIRGGRRGSHAVSLLAQWDLGAQADHEREQRALPPGSPPPYFFVPR